MGALHFIMKMLVGHSSRSSAFLKLKLDVKFNNYVSSLILCQSRKPSQESINRVELSKPLLLLFNKSWHTKGSSSELEKANVVAEFLKVKQDDPGNCRSSKITGRLKLDTSNKKMKR